MGEIQLFVTSLSFICKTEKRKRSLKTVKDFHFNKQLKLIENVSEVLYTFINICISAHASRYFNLSSTNMLLTCRTFWMKVSAK